MGDIKMNYSLIGEYRENDRSIYLHGFSGGVVGKVSGEGAVVSQHWYNPVLGHVNESGEVFSACHDRCAIIGRVDDTGTVYAGHEYKRAIGSVEGGDVRNRQLAGAALLLLLRFHKSKDGLVSHDFEAPCPLLYDVKPDILDKVLQEYGLLDVNNLAIGFYKNRGSASDLNDLFDDMIKASRVNNINEVIQELLSRYDDTGAPDWRGHRFVLRYAARYASHISQVELRDWTDVLMRDGTCKELKSLTFYGSGTKDKIIRQISNRLHGGTRSISVVFDSQCPHPPSQFLEKLERDMEKLRIQYNANVNWESDDGSIERMFWVKTQVKNLSSSAFHSILSLFRRNP